MITKADIAKAKKSKQPMLLIVKSNNPIVKQYSIIRLQSILNLSEAAICRHLEYDRIWVDDREEHDHNRVRIRLSPNGRVYETERFFIKIKRK